VGKSGSTVVVGGVGRLEEDLTAIHNLRLLAHAEPKSPHILHKWIKAFLGFHIPTEAPTEGQTAPFKFVCDAFFGEFERALVLAARGQGKTRDVSILNLMTSKFKPGTHTVHLGAITQQSNWGHGYLRDMLKPKYMSDDVVKSERSLVEWKNGSWVRTSTGHTDTGVTAIRGNRVVQDEIDQWDMQLFETSQMMIQGTDRNPAQRIYISTQYTAYGLMGQLWQEADARGYKTYKWDLWCGIQRCKKCYEKACPLFIWENPKTGEVEPLCQGRALRSDGYVPRKAVIDEFLATDKGEWQTQKNLAEPTREYLVLPTFSAERHGGEAPEEAFAPGTPRACGVDWGFDHPLAFTVFAQLGLRYWGIHEHLERFVGPQGTVEIARELDAKFGPELIFYCDPARPDSIAMLVEAGLIAAPCPVRSREARHTLVRGLLAKDHALKEPRLMFDAKRMPITIWQMGTVHRDEKSGKEVQELNDGYDSASYVLASAELSGGIAAGGGFLMTLATVVFALLCLLI
jgi:hypothetical protein